MFERRSRPSPSSCATLVRAAVGAFALLSSVPALALPTVRMTPVGTHVVEVAGRYQVPAGQDVDWEIELCNDTAAALLARFEDDFHGGECPADEFLSVVCPPVELGGGWSSDCSDLGFGRVRIVEVPVAVGACATVAMRTTVDLLTPPGTTVGNIAFYFTDVENGQTSPPGGVGCTEIDVVEAYPTDLTLRLRALTEADPFAAGEGRSTVLLQATAENFTVRPAEGEIRVPLPPDLRVVETTRCPAGATCSGIGTSEFVATGVTVAQGALAVAGFRAETTCASVGSPLACVQAQFVPAEAPTEPILSDSILGTPDLDPACIELVGDEIVLEKTYALDDVDGSGLPSAGDRVRYSIAAWNRGGAAARGVVVTDQLPLGFLTDGVVVDSRGTFDPGSRTATWNLPELGPGSRVELVLDAEMAAASVACNRARLSTFDTRSCGVEDVDSDDPFTATAGDCTRVQDMPPQALSVEKTLDFEDADGDGRPAAGEPVTVAITVRNEGPGTVPDADLLDLLPACWDDLTGLTIRPAGAGSNSSTAREVRVGGLGGPAGLASGESVTVSFMTAADSPGGCCNQAAVSWGGGTAMVVSDDPTTGLEPGDATCAISLAPALDFTKEAEALDGNGDGELQVGERVRWTIRVKNRGSVLGSAILADELGPGLLLDPTTVTVEPGGTSPTYVPPPGGVDGFGRLELRDVRVETFAPLVVTFETELGPEAEGVTCNRATLLAEGQSAAWMSEDASTGDGATCVNVTVVPRPVLELDLAASGPALVDCAVPGESVVVDLALTVGGTAPATGTTLDLFLAGPWEVIDAADGTILPDRVAFSLGTVGVGDTVERSVTLRLPCDALSGTRLSLDAEAASPAAEAPAVDPGLTLDMRLPRLVGTIVQGMDDLDGDGALDVDETARLSVELEERGGCAAAFAAVELDVDPALVVVSVLDGGVETPGLVRWDAASTAALAEIAPGGTTSVSVDVSLAPTAENCAMPLVVARTDWLRGVSPPCPDRDTWSADEPGPDGDCVTTVPADLLRADDVTSRTPLEPALSTFLDATGEADTCLEGLPRIDPSRVFEPDVAGVLGPGVLVPGDALPVGGGPGVLVFYEVSNSCATIRACKTDADGDPANGRESVLVTTGACVP